MNYRNISPGDGYDYPFIYDWVENIKGFPMDLAQPGALYLSIANGRYGSAIYTPDFLRLAEQGLGNTHIVETLGCPPERASVIEHFILSLFNERKSLVNARASKGG